ncbi:MAG: calcium-translocating P-type ATPase, PMCA-type [Candidatus Aenigmarchaeota archaeon ex4484_224]|nr:MAG: calcium-translocating P-type ATPase, PMCA-type [Candidatus Aenigmarchaeota archaeon ex4484_224]
MQYLGLTSEEAKKRLQIYGKNEIRRKKKVSPIQIFLSQFKSPIILLLIFAAIISLAINYHSQESFFDSILILIIVFAAAIAGFVQDYKAERAIEALQKLSTPKAKVIRDGKKVEVDSTEIVPGDILVLEAGDIVPADAEILEGELELDESILTGESKAVKKKVKEKIFSGTSVYTGKAYAKVLLTGMKTEIGKIAAKMQEIGEEETPFQKHMKSFTKKLVILTLLIIAVTLAVAAYKFGWLEGFLIAVSLAVAAVPEDLPAVITVSLSLGAREMSKRNALVRRLAITESIGSVDVICTDKTGTLTLGKMKVRDIWFFEKSDLANDLAIKVCYYCNDAELVKEEGKEKFVGDETDIALKEFSFGKIEEEGKRIDQIAFSSERKMMSVVYELRDGKFVFSKGAPEVIISKSSKILKGKIAIDLDENLKKKILEKNNEFASQGYRVLGLAYKPYSLPIEQNLIFIGLVILSDPPRPEVKEAIHECYSAGIRVIMITGDNEKTALAIAKEIGLITEGAILGEQIDKMNDEQLAEILNKGINVFARTNPFHKLRILEILQKQGHVVAMTGDGVNDSLALKKADVGISMGIRGTEVAKEASDVILLDDNFATIRNAIKEGRRIFDNIRKFVDYLLTCNVAEVIVVLLSTLFLPFISLYPVQILWINLITDGLPALALSVDPARPDVMKRKPRKKGEGIINKKLALLIGSIGIKKSLVILGTFLLVLPLGIEKARTTLFTAFILYEFVRIAVIRFNEKMFNLKGWLSNKFLLYSLIGSLFLQGLLVYSPLGIYFKTVPLEIYEWKVLIGGTAVGLITGILIAWIIDKITKEEY